MRSFWLALLAGAALAPCAAAGDLRNFDDAALHSLQFVDRSEGWAVGDEGAVWHTIDGGASWERQPTGVRASLRSVCFLNPYTGWVAGREELPYGNGSVGVLLVTRDGGLKWKRVTLNALPGLNVVRFKSDQVGFLAGDGTDLYPSGVFQTKDGGRSWQPVAGPRCPTWLAGDFGGDQGAALAGAWNRLATLHQDRLALADVDWLGGRNLRGLHLKGKRGVAVGQGGLVLLSEGTAGSAWSLADLKLSSEARAAIDFHGVHSVGRDIWVVGRPGSVVLHSTDRGETWTWQKTAQPLPLNGVFFIDEAHGWAVGELGTILGTEDGGQTWKPQRRGGQRAALLVVQAQGGGVPLESVALVGGEQGYLTAALRVAAPDPATAAPGRATEGQRLAAAMRQAGGAAGEMLWQFPLPQHLAESPAADLLKNWDKAHADRAAEDLLRQLVLTLRTWRPNVVVGDWPTADGVDALVAEAVKEAIRRAADPQAFPEQIGQMGLEAWQCEKLYALCPDRAASQVAQDVGEIYPRLQSSPRDFASPAAGLLVEHPVAGPTQRFFRLVSATLDGAAGHRDLMQGIRLAEGGEARRTLTAIEGLSPDRRKAGEVRRNLQALAEAPSGPLNDPNKLLSQVGPTLAGLPDDQAAPAAYAVASQFARQGQWELAREIYLLVADRYPAHPLAADALRWLIRHNTSSEVRRRHELGQFLIVSKTEMTASQAIPEPRADARPMNEPQEGDGSDPPQAAPPRVEVRRTTQTTLLDSGASIRRWYEGGVQMESRLAAMGPLFANDPAVQFCLHSARRTLGDFETPRQWYTQFVAKQPPGPWRDAAQAELWLATRTGSPAKPVALCRQTDTRPLLDGKFEDACWKNLKPLVLKNAAGDTTGEYPTEVRFAFDQEYLYLAVNCKHPAGKDVPPIKGRQRDANLAAYDRVSVLLDLDRDYHTCYQLQIDQRGCVRDDCWGDLGWNPRWFVAVQSGPEGWQAEAAIPLMELTSDAPSQGKTWACNVVRVLPGRGVQGWSLPADVTPRPEGMGLLMFTQELKQTAANPSGRVMPRAP